MTNHDDAPAVLGPAGDPRTRLEPAGEWLSLAQASELLGIHPSTLRQWSDEGKIKTFRTPGGHRRYARAEVAHFIKLAHGAPQQPATMARAALSQTREEIAAKLPSQPWAGAMDREDVERKRRRGRQLLGLMVQYMSRRKPETSLLDEGCELGREYGRDMAQDGASLIDATMAFLFFRDSVLESIFQLPDTRGLDHDEGLEMFQRLGQFMNQVLRAMMEAHESTARSLAGG